jgi:hypothetical protein
MSGILSTRRIGYIILVLVIFYPVCSYTDENIIEQYATQYSLEEICDGLVIDDEFYFATFPLYSLEQDTYDVEDLLEEENYLFVTCSPYLCGGCKRTNISLANHLASKYPGKVMFLVENWYIRDTIKGLEEANISRDVQIFLDNNGNNISRLKKLHQDLISAFYIVIDANNKIRYLVGSSYSYSPEKEKFEEIIVNIESYLE